MKFITCTLGLTNDLIDGGQARAKLHLCKAKPNHVLKTALALGWLLVNQVYQGNYIKFLGNPRVQVRPHLKY